MKIIYTESALLELERFQKQKKEELESILKNKKYVFGDDVVEITASDIREVEKYFQVFDNSKSQMPFTYFIFKIYMGLGIIMLIIGLFYQYINMFNLDPIQRSLILVGASLSIISFFGNLYLRFRQNLRRDELERRYREYEHIPRSDDKKIL